VLKSAASEGQLAVRNLAWLDHWRLAENDNSMSDFVVIRAHDVERTVRILSIVERKKALLLETLGKVVNEIRFWHIPDC
jgi:hypothetical protein